MSRTATTFEAIRDAQGDVPSKCASDQFTDADIAAEIGQTLKQASPIDEGCIQIVVKHGVVALYGHVRCWTEWHIVERAAWCSPGVHLVQNHLVIAYETGAQETRSTPERQVL